MSATVLEDAKKNILARLKELEPQRIEYDELRSAATDLKLDYEPATTNGQRRELLPAAARTASRSGSRRKRAQGKRAGRSSGKTRRDQMLEAIKATPGITVKQIGEQLGLKDATSLYRVQRELAAEKVIRKEGQGLYLVDPAPTA